MAKSGAYWNKRFEILEEASNAYGQDAFRKIEPAFEQAQREIEKEINSWYGRFAKNNQITIEEARKLLTASELKELKWDIDEYIKYGHENDMNQLWMKELENASAKYHISRLEALKLRTQQAAEVAFGNELDEIDSMARKVIGENYYHTIYEVQKGFNLGWEVGQIDERKLERLISKPWVADGKNFSNRIWEQRSQLVNELHTQLTRTCVLGKAPDDAIKAISKKFDVTKSQAGRLVMTEQAYFHSVSQKEAFEELDVEEYEIVATLDSHTSEVCQEMDGQHFPMKDYQPGVTAPPFHVWCRSVTVPYFDDEFSLGERAARDADGKTYYVPSDMKYKDWKKSMVDGDTKGLTNVSLNDTMNLNNIEMFSKKVDSREGFKFISDEKFDSLTIEARKNGATILRGTDEVEQHLDKMKANASTIGDVLLFRKNVCVSEVIEETYHFKQNMNKVNDDKGEPLRTILNEILAKEHIIKNAKKFKIPRNEIEFVEKQLKSYQNQLEEYNKRW